MLVTHVVALDTGYVLNRQTVFCRADNIVASCGRGAEVASTSLSWRISLYDGT
jgi:hypothetical protein